MKKVLVNPQTILLKTRTMFAQIIKFKKFEIRNSEDMELSNNENLYLRVIYVYKMKIKTLFLRFISSSILTPKKVDNEQQISPCRIRRFECTF